MSEQDLALAGRARKMGIALSTTQSQQFETYRSLLLDWNKKMDLTAITDAAEIDNKHFLDSLSILRFFPNGIAGRVIDVGTGAGFPSLPVKIINPSISLTLVDSLNKRVLFLQEVVQALKLTDVSLFHARAEDFLQAHAENPYREMYDYVFARAVAPLPTLLEYTLPALRIGGELIAMKGPNALQEVADSQNALKELGGELIETDSFVWTEQKLQRVNLRIRKASPTPERYPRKNGKAKKRPL